MQLPGFVGKPRNGSALIRTDARRRRKARPLKRYLHEVARQQISRSALSKRMVSSSAQSAKPPFSNPGLFGLYWYAVLPFHYPVRIRNGIYLPSTEQIGQKVG